MDLKERIGAWLTAEGCFFRVWAPHADSLTVRVQDGSQWETQDIIVKQDLIKNGEYWSGTVPGVKAGQLYRFEIKHSDGSSIERLDPAARDVVDSELLGWDSTNGSLVLRGGQDGQWTQILCTQDAAFGGWDGAGNAFHDPWTQLDGHVYINLPKWSVVILCRK
jgi:1,4-alpha-glucan branching enzyme